MGYFYSICLAGTSNLLVGVGMLSELALHHVDREWARKEIKGEEDAFELRHREDMYSIESEL